MFLYGRVNFYRLIYLPFPAEEELTLKDKFC